MSMMTCPTCGGRGAVANAKTGSAEPCPNCGGEGQRPSGNNDLPFWYVFLPTPGSSALVLTANQLGVGASVIIDNDADFMCDRIVSSSTGNFSVFLTNRYTSQPMMPSQSVPIDGENLAGSASLPFWLPKPFLIRRTSTIQGIFNDRSGAPNTIQMALVGYKIS